MRTIKPLNNKYAEVAVPGSKSYTHRMLIAAALSKGQCIINNPLESEDTNLTLQALTQLGVQIDKQVGHWVVNGCNGRLGAAEKQLFLGNSGTSMRLLTAVAALAEGEHVLSGTDRMQQRPIKDLMDGLDQIGVETRSLKKDGFPPVAVVGEPIKGGKIEINCSTSSQFLSALLLIGPCTQTGLDITVTAGPVSRPYVDITVDVMQQFGVTVQRKDYDWFRVPGRQSYRAGVYTVEPDCSQAGYFWAAGAITGTTIKVKAISADSRQGDIRLLALLNTMGCQIIEESDGIGVCGRPLVAVETDMADMPDMVPTLAVVSAFANGKTILKNVDHLQDKESNRLAAVINELSKMGIDARYHDHALIIHGGQPHGAEIDTYNDHRIAMSFAVAGLKIAGICVKNESCVEKSFPNFWEVFDGLYQRSAEAL
jgi:3-phosphoshikimate 1-carboxyvinyltransferase